MLWLFVKKDPTDNTKLETKIIRKTSSAASHFDVGTLTQALQTEVDQNAQTVSYKLLSLFAKQIPREITKLQTKIIEDTIQQKINFMQHNEPRSWISIETNIHAKSAKTLSLLVKEIPIYITKLEPKITTEDSIYG